MKLKQLYPFITLVFCMSVFSCGKNSACFKGTGKIIEEQRTISNEVTSIKTENNIDIVLTQASEASLTLEGGSNLLPYINTEISGSQLTISSDNRCGMFRDYSIPITAYLSLPNLTDIEYTGQGDISSTHELVLPNFRLETSTGTGSINLELKSDEISVIQNTGPADINITGSTNYLYTYLGEMGSQNYKGLAAKSVHTSSAGTGVIVVNPIENLLVEIIASGNVEYYGSPVIIVSKNSGSGKLIKK